MLWKKKMEKIELFILRGEKGENYCTRIRGIEEEEGARTKPVRYNLNWKGDSFRQAHGKHVSKEISSPIMITECQYALHSCASVQVYNSRYEQRKSMYCIVIKLKGLLITIQNSIYQPVWGPLFINYNKEKIFVYLSNKMLAKFYGNV